MNKRKRYTQEEKNTILFQYALGNSANESFKQAGFDISLLDVSDKKYAAKLINKWKKELYNNSTNKFVGNLSNFFVVNHKKQYEDEEDFIMQDYLQKAKARNNRKSDTLY